MWDLWEKKYHTLILPRVWLKTKITQIHALVKTRNHCFDQYILYHRHSYMNSAPLQRRILVSGKHAGSKNDERLVWNQLCARNKVFNEEKVFWRKEERRFEWSILMKGKITQRPSSQTDANSPFTIALNNPRTYVSQWKLCDKNTWKSYICTAENTF